MYDYLIIGAGVTGASIARELSKYDAKTCVLEKENDVGNHATIANSAIVHSGHDPEEGSLKAKLCVRGNALYEDLNKELGIPLLRTGGYVVAHNLEEEETLEMLRMRAHKNNVPDVHYVALEDAKKAEPAISDSITKVLSLPTTKVTYPWEVAIASIENAIDNGVRFYKNQEVVSITKRNGIFSVKTTSQTFKARVVINAAGAFAGKIAALIEDNVPYKITPRRGEYFVLDRRVKGFINHTLYPVPTKKGKGVLIVPQVHGNILVGPNSEFQDGLDATNNTREGLNYVRSESAQLAKNIPFNLVIRTFTGIRATSTHKDFFIQESRTVNNFIHVAGIDSPGLTAAPAIGEYVVNEILNKDKHMKLNQTYNPKRQAIKMFHDMTDGEKAEAFKQDSRYGNLVCKCEKITEGDIVHHIHRNVPGDTIKGVKKRARAGSGICQGGYCEHQVLKIIARELNQDLTLVDYYHKNTPLLLKETKVKNHD